MRYAVARQAQPACQLLATMGVYVIVCVRCNSQMIEGTLFCEECGYNLLDQSKRQSSTTQIETQEDGNISVRSGWGTASFDDARQVVVYIRDVSTPLTIEPHDGFTIGRADKEREFVPDLDLNDFGGLEKGVSRRHAAFGRGDGVLTITDLDSANGTYLNGVRIGTQPRVLRDGDEIRLGNLTCYVYFQ